MKRAKKISIQDFQAKFNSEEKCRLTLEQMRWNGSVVCPYCNCGKVYRYNNGKRFDCGNKECRRVFSVTVGTFIENTKLPLSKWFLAIYILTVHSKGISSVMLADMVGVSQKTAWFMAHRIRGMMQGKSGKLFSFVEVDETYIGGSDTNRHQHKKKGKSSKVMVMGAIQRGGNLKVKVLLQPNLDNMQKFIDNSVEKGASLMTDESHYYKKIGESYNHETINHNKKEYVRKGDKNIHTNIIEGFWNLLKKQIDGIHHFVTPKHLQRYCDEASYRYINRGLELDSIILTALGNCNGRLTYNQLISDEESI